MSSTVQSSGGSSVVEVAPYPDPSERHFAVPFDRRRNQLTVRPNADAKLERFLFNLDHTQRRRRSWRTHQG